MARRKKLTHAEKIAARKELIGKVHAALVLHDGLARPVVGHPRQVEQWDAFAKGLSSAASAAAEVAKGYKVLGS